MKITQVLVMNLQMKISGSQTAVILTQILKILVILLHPVTGNAVLKGYNDVDEEPPAPTPKFRPAREPGVHLNDEILTKVGVRKFLHPSDFFKLYFTVDLVNMLVLYTNKYAAHFGPTKPTVYKG
ncbi:piggyBac transposable element-derived protein 3, partial [Biomphalaria pfeifferi]